MFESSIFREFRGTKKLFKFYKKCKNLPEIEQTIQEAINHKANTYTHDDNIPYIEKFDSPGNLPKIITDIISVKKEKFI